MAGTPTGSDRDPLGIMLRGGECLVLRYRSGSELGISVDDAERGAGLINALLEDIANSRSS